MTRRLIHSDIVLIRIEGSNLPGNSCGPSPEVPEGYRNIHVGVQRKNRPAELLDMVSAVLNRWKPASASQ